MGLLRALWARYERREIYTWVGTVLVSVNPYQDVGAFHEDLAAAYASDCPPQAPHLYATVRAALTAPDYRHALLITGESGAGKTEATRAVLSFLAMRHNCVDRLIRDRLLGSTPVLEAFGNAHTRQNTNSSRFGKFIEVHLSATSEVVGATLQPYMLEASRVAGELPEGERTYHVFYLLRAALTAMKSRSTSSGTLCADLADVPEWADLAQSCEACLAKSSRLTTGPPQAQCVEWFEELHDGLVTTGMQHAEVAECCRIVAAVALLADTEAGDSVLGSAAALLRIKEQDLRHFLAKAEMSVGAQGRERLFRARSEREAATLRNSLAQELYAALFGWLTRLVARGIAPPQEESEEDRSPAGRRLGLLDLYGFEVFASNGFEQFLINYCNERLQQFFNRQVFTMEAEEYTAEGLDGAGQWKRLVAACQLPALALLEGEPGSSVGVFGIINDRSRCGFEDANGSAALVHALSSSFGNHPAFRPTAKDLRVFGVAHFAGEVFYEAATFQRKNASAHRPDVAAFLRAHGGAFVREVVGGEGNSAATDAVNSLPGATAQANRRRKLFGRTLISAFREELNELCITLEMCQCHHVRCLRPNDEQAALMFDDVSMLRQCRYSGLMEATRIRRQGFAHRRPLAVFASRFALLLGSRDARKLARQASNERAAAVCSAICQAASAAGISNDDATIGRTKVFLREAALAWFENARIQVAANVIAATVRGHQTRQSMARLRMLVLKLQAMMRGWRGRRLAAERREVLRLAAERARAERLAEERRLEQLRAAQARINRAAVGLQRWWRRRAARMRSMVAAVRREQEQILKQKEAQQWKEAEELQAALAPLSAKSVQPQSPVLISPRQSPVYSGRHSNRGERPRERHSSAREPRERDLGQRICQSVLHDDMDVPPPRVPLPAAQPRSSREATRVSLHSMEQRRRPASHQSRRVHQSGVCGRAREPQPVSPRTLRRSYRQEIARLLAQHRQLRKRLPAELRSLPAELMEAAHALGHNGPPVDPEVLTRINEVLHTLKAALNLKENQSQRTSTSLAAAAAAAAAQASVNGPGSGCLHSPELLTSCCCHSCAAAALAKATAMTPPAPVAAAPCCLSAETQTSGDDLLPPPPSRPVSAGRVIGRAMRRSQSARPVLRRVHHSPRRVVAYTSPLRSPPVTVVPDTAVTLGSAQPMTAAVPTWTWAAHHMQGNTMVVGGTEATTSASAAPAVAATPPAPAGGASTPSAQVLLAAIPTPCRRGRGQAGPPRRCRLSPSPAKAVGSSGAPAVLSARAASPPAVRVRLASPAVPPASSSAFSSARSHAPTISFSPSASPTASPTATPNVPPLAPSGAASAAAVYQQHASVCRAELIAGSPPVPAGSSFPGASERPSLIAEPTVPTWLRMVAPPLSSAGTGAASSCGSRGSSPTTRRRL